jgi:hypothetical protein
LEDFLVIHGSVEVTGDLEQPLEFGRAFRQRFYSRTRRYGIGQISVNAIEQWFEPGRESDCEVRRLRRRLSNLLADAKDTQKRAVGLCERYSRPPLMESTIARHRGRLRRFDPPKRADPLGDRVAGQLTLLPARLKRSIQQTNPREISDQAVCERNVRRKDWICAPCRL